MASRLTIRTHAGSADLTSMTQLLSLGLAQGDEVQIRVSGPDEELAAARLKELFERRFDFPPRGADASSAPLMPAGC